MSKLRFLLALWAAKLSIPALKLTHHQGTDFPGVLAVKICPDFLRYIDKPHTIVTVTGTNGKTTCTNMLVDILEADGLKVLSNRAGSNIITGISTALLKNATLFGKQKPVDLAVLEVDERSSPLIYPHVIPNMTVLINLFRDSIMRNGHPGYIADILSSSIPQPTKLVVNADDLLASQVAPENPRVTFGIGRLPTDITECVNLINDVRICPRCAGPITYEYRRYHHIGHARCPKCGFASPDADFFISSVDFAKKEFILEEGGEKYTYPVITDNIFNVYNQLTCVTALRQLGMPHEKIRRYMAGCKVVSSRHNVENYRGYDILMQMTKEKNALANSRNFDYIQSRPAPKELFLMVSCLGVATNWSENPSWMYDTDFEFLNRDNIHRIVCTGPRAADFRLRLLYAGIPAEKIFYEPDEEKALSCLTLTPGREIGLLHGVDSTALAHRLKAKLKTMIDERLATEGKEEV